MSEFTSEFLLRELDEPLLFLYWTVDEISTFLLPFLMLFFLGHLLLGLGVGLALFQGWKYIKTQLGRNRGAVDCARYKYFPTPQKKGLPNSAISGYLT